MASGSYYMCSLYLVLDRLGQLDCAEVGAATASLLLVQKLIEEASSNVSVCCEYTLSCSGEESDHEAMSTLAHIPKYWILFMLACAPPTCT